MTFKVGDVVKLKSNSPKMTVDSVNQNPTKDLVRCIWFSGDHVQSGNFSEETLETVAPTVKLPHNPHFCKESYCRYDDDFFPIYKPNTDDLIG